MFMMLLQSTLRSEVGYLTQDGLKLRVVQELGENVGQLMCFLDMRYDYFLRCNQLAQKTTYRTNAFGPRR